ncbi:MAG TPA: hypothetical protein VKQ27_16580, partial [Acetobacteraceae bacterium]|nr:hypothetical protein [Acetobacteraceae bacterium]
RQRLEFEDRLGLYERLDAHSMVVWMSFLMGDLAGADRESADMVSRLLPGQAPYPALHLYAWRTITLHFLGRWDEAASMFWRDFEVWNEAGSHAAIYALRGFICGIDLGRARGDGRIEMAAQQAITSVLSRVAPTSGLQRLHDYMKGESAFTTGEWLGAYPAEMVERRLNLANDCRQAVPDNVIEETMNRAVRYKIPLLEAQTRRTIALGRKDAQEMSNAIAIWERIGAVPLIGRAKAERGLITGEEAETESGLQILSKLGDAFYLDRFSHQI